MRCSLNELFKIPLLLFRCVGTPPCLSWLLSLKSSWHEWIERLVWFTEHCEAGSQTLAPVDIIALQIYVQFDVRTCSPLRSEWARLCLLLVNLPGRNVVEIRVWCASIESDWRKAKEGRNEAQEKMETAGQRGSCTVTSEEVAVQEPVGNSVREKTSRRVNVCYLTLDSEVEDDVMSHRPPLGLNHVTWSCKDSMGYRTSTRWGD